MFPANNFKNYLDRGTVKPLEELKQMFKIRGWAKIKDEKTGRVLEAVNWASPMAVHRMSASLILAKDVTLFFPDFLLL